MTPVPPQSGWEITRRDFLSSASCAAAGFSIAAGCAHLPGGKRSGPIRFGIVADAHYADRPSGGSRKYSESIVKMTECVDVMNAQGVEFLVNLGDLKDQGPKAIEAETLTYLEAIEQSFRGFRGSRYHVLGNHDVDSISKNQFLDRVEITGVEPGRSYYSFETRGLHCVVLDACYRSDGVEYDHGNFNWTDANIPKAQLAWLKADLATSSLPIIVFAHQQLDPEGHKCVKNAGEVRAELVASGRVLAVFQGHHHKGQYTFSENIHYYTLIAMVEGKGATNNSYAIVDIHEDNSMTVTGYRKAKSFPPKG